MGSYDNLNLNLCETLYAQGAAAVVTPHYTYRHADKVVLGEACPAGGSAIAGLQFYTGTRFPAAYRDGLFFADYTRSCIWFMPKGADGLPDPAQRQTFASGATGIVNLIQGPDGNLYYPDLNGGTVKRISFGSPNDAPTARATATPSSGAVPLAVQFDGTTSTDPNGDALTYDWDLDGDGDYDDSTAARPTRTLRRGRRGHRAAARHRPRRPAGHHERDRDRRRPADGADRHARGRRAVHGRRGDPVLRQREGLAGRGHPRDPV